MRGSNKEDSLDAHFPHAPFWDLIKGLTYDQSAPLHTYPLKWY